MSDQQPHGAREYAQPTQMQQYPEGYYPGAPKGDPRTGARPQGEYNYVNMLFKEPGAPQSDDGAHQGRQPFFQQQQLPWGFQQQAGFFNYDAEGGYPPQMLYSQMYQDPYGYYGRGQPGGLDYFVGQDKRLYAHLSPQQAREYEVMMNSGNFPEEEGGEEEGEGDGEGGKLATHAAQQALPYDQEAGDAVYQQLGNLSLEEQPAPVVPEGVAAPTEQDYEQYSRAYRQMQNRQPQAYRQPRSWADVLKEGPGAAVPPAPAPGAPGLPMMMPPHMAPFPYPQPPMDRGYPARQGGPMGGGGGRRGGPQSGFGPRGGNRRGRGNGNRRGGNYNNSGEPRQQAPRDGSDPSNARPNGGQGNNNNPNNPNNPNSNNSGTGSNGGGRRRVIREGGPATASGLGLNHLLHVNAPAGSVDLNPGAARYFVIKSYSEDDVHKAMKYDIWTSTESGNKRLDRAYREHVSANKGPIYLFFSVNASGRFCGVAEMTSPVDYNAKSDVWNQVDKWTGQFTIRWVYIKDMPNGLFRHIRLQNNDNKPVTNSRDTQEVPVKQGKEVLKIFATTPARGSLLDDWDFYNTAETEKRVKTEAPTEGSDEASAADSPSESK